MVWYEEEVAIGLGGFHLVHDRRLSTIIETHHTYFHFLLGREPVSHGAEKPEKESSVPMPPLSKKRAPSAIQASGGEYSAKKIKLATSAGGGLNKAFKLPIPGAVLDPNTIQVL